MTTLHLPNGWVVLLRTVAMHRRKPRRKDPYSRPTDWLAAAGKTTAWGRTRREAIDNLRTALKVEWPQFQR
jgi:hypothetical protein